MSKLKAIQPIGMEARKPKIVVYGKAGVGKTWTSLDFPKVYYIDSEGGATREQYTDKLRAANGVYLGIENGAGDFDTLIDQVKALATEKHSFKTLVIDSFTKVFINEIAKEAERLEAAGTKDEFGLSKKPAVRKSRTLVRWLNLLDMNVILICHEKQLYEKGEAVGFTFDGYEKLDYELDLVLQISKEGLARKARVVKSRLESFPEGNRIDWSYEEFAKRYGRETIEKQGEAIVLISADQLKAINNLLDVVKLEDDWLRKVLEKAGVDALEELPQDKAAKVLEVLQKKVGK
jgi:hypothetical protein